MSTDTTTAHREMPIALLFRQGEDVASELAPLEEMEEDHYLDEAVFIRPPRLQEIAVAQPSPAQFGLSPETDWMITIETVPSDAEDITDWSVIPIELQEEVGALYEKVEELYHIRPNDEEAVHHYINNCPFLLQPLMETHGELSKYFGSECESELVMINDPEEGHQELYIRIKAHLSSQNLIAQRIAFYKQYFRHFSLPVRKQLNITVIPK